MGMKLKLGIDNDLKFEIKSELISRAPASATGQILLLTFSLLFVGTKFLDYPGLYISAIGIFCCSTARFLWSWAKMVKHSDWLAVHILIVLFNALSWAGFSFFHAMHFFHDTAHLIFTYFLIAGIISAASYSLGPSRIMFVIFVSIVSLGGFFPLLFSSESKSLNESIFYILLVYVAFTIRHGFINYAEWRVKIMQQLKLYNSAKLAALGEMAGGVAHEINNPLGIVHGKANQLIRHINNQSYTAEIGLRELKKIVEMTERVSKILTGLRSFSRNADKDPFAKIDMGTITNNVLSLCAEKFKYHQIELRLNIDPQLFFECRSVQIEQVLLNLLNNAHDAVLPLKEKWVSVETKDLGDALQISVTDSGQGISPEVAAKLMQPFFTTKEVGRGTGLGLSISKGIVEDHGGSLTLDASSPNTRFVIRLAKSLTKFKSAA